MTSSLGWGDGRSLPTFRRCRVCTMGSAQQDYTRGASPNGQLLAFRWLQLICS